MLQKQIQWIIPCFALLHSTAADINNNSVKHWTLKHNFISKTFSLALALSNLFNCLSNKALPSFTIYLTFKVSSGISFKVFIYLWNTELTFQNAFLNKLEIINSVEVYLMVPDRSMTGVHQVRRAMSAQDQDVWP